MCSFVAASPTWLRHLGLVIDALPCHRRRDWRANEHRTVRFYWLQRIPLKTTCGTIEHTKDKLGHQHRVVGCLFAGMVRAASGVLDCNQAHSWWRQVKSRGLGCACSRKTKRPTILQQDGTISWPVLGSTEDNTAAGSAVARAVPLTFPQEMARFSEKASRFQHRTALKISLLST